MSNSKSTLRAGGLAPFNDEYLKNNLKSLTVRGGTVTVAAQGAQLILQMASTVVLARLLAPADYGIVGMVTVVIGFGYLFKDLGLSLATVQKTDINHGQISNLFWINVIISVCLALVIAVIAPLIALFYDEPRLRLITIALSVSFVFEGLKVQHNAIMQRRMQFTALSSIQIISMLTGTAIGITAALSGAGYWSLVAMQLTTALTSMMCVWFFCEWRPGRPVKGSGVKGMLVFGANLTGFSVLNFFARNLDNVLIGKYCGAAALGLYSKAYGLMMLPLSQINAPISAVAIPALSRLHDDPDEYRKYYLRAISLIAFVTMPAMVFLAVMSKQVILLVLGPKWVEAARIFSFLAVAGLGQPMANSTGWLFISQGRTRDMLRWGIVGSSVTVLAFLLGLHWGPVGVAACYAAVNCAVIPLLFWFVGRKGPVSDWDVLRTVLPFLWVSLCVLGALVLFREYMPALDLIFQLVGGLVVTALVAPLALMLAPRGTQHLKDFLNIFTLLKRSDEKVRTLG
jgi:O-antigen/teichoic acid export membrane protein